MIYYYTIFSEISNVCTINISIIIYDGSICLGSDYRIERVGAVDDLRYIMYLLAKGGEYYIIYSIKIYRFKSSNPHIANERKVYRARMSTSIMHDT